MQVFGLSALEAVRIRPHRIRPHRQQRQQVVPGSICFYVASLPGSLRDSRHGCPRDRRPGFIRDIAGDASRGLRMQARRSDQSGGTYNREQKQLLEGRSGGVFRHLGTLRFKC